MKNRIHILSFIAGLLAFLFASVAYAENVRYRFKNAQGTLVISNNLPAEYAQQGYDIIDTSNNVIKRVAPAPSKEHVAEAERRREALAAYEILKRRYSQAEDIERAKQRRLENINTNISILNGTISNLKNKIDELVQQAAAQERAGRTVPKTILNQLEDTKAELSVSEKLLANRQEEYIDAAKRFDENIEVFKIGQKIREEENADN